MKGPWLYTDNGSNADHLCAHSDRSAVVQRAADYGMPLASHNHGLTGCSSHRWHGKAWQRPAGGFLTEKWEEWVMARSTTYISVI